MKHHIDLDEEIEQLDANFKSKLINWGQRERKSVEFELIEEGNGGKRLLRVRLLIDGQEISQEKIIPKKEQNKLLRKKHAPVWASEIYFCLHFPPFSYSSYCMSGHINLSFKTITIQLLFSQSKSNMAKTVLKLNEEINLTSCSSESFASKRLPAW